MLLRIVLKVAVEPAEDVMLAERRATKVGLVRLGLENVPGACAFSSPQKQLVIMLKQTRMQLNNHERLQVKNQLSISASEDCMISATRVF